MPAALTTIHSPSCSASIVDCFILTVDCGGGAGTGSQPLPSSTALTTCGVKRVPPLATVIIMTASEIGVTLTWPWPIETEIVSPGYHFGSRVVFFHSVDGTSPLTSFGRSMPLRSPRPRSDDHLWILSTPSMLPRV